jgi:hypothetical protein
MEVSMKGRIAVAALGLVLAGAQPVEAREVLATAENRAGGDLLLTDVECEGGLVMMSTLSGGQAVSYGCASHLPPGRIYVQWDDGQRSVFERGIFSRTTSGNAFVEKHGRDEQRAPQGRPARVYR